MKKVLFVLQSIGYGGSMTSLINLSNLLRNDPEIETHILFMNRFGALLPQAEKAADVLPEDKDLQAVSMSRSQIIKMKRYDLWIRRMWYRIKSKMPASLHLKDAYTVAARKYSGKYDCVIAYQESIATNFVSHIAAGKKMAWVHNDYENVIKMYRSPEHLRCIYDKYNKVVCVSQAGMRNFQRLSGLAPEKIVYVYNTLLGEQLTAKSELPLKEVLAGSPSECMSALDRNCLKFVSSGRFSQQKRFDRVVEVAVKLKASHVDFVWMILGNGALFDEIHQKIRESGLEKNVFLTGGLTNPFPVIKACDVFVLTSDFEAHPMVANESLILGKPVISTNFESASEVVEHEKNGLICGMDTEDIYNAVVRIHTDRSLYETLLHGAEKFCYSNEKIVDQVRKLIL